MQEYFFKRSEGMSLITVLFLLDLVSLYIISIWQELTAWGHNRARAVLVFVTEKKMRNQPAKLADSTKNDEAGLFWWVSRKSSGCPLRIEHRSVPAP